VTGTGVVTQALQLGAGHRFAVFFSAYHCGDAVASRESGTLNRGALRCVGSGRNADVGDGVHILKYSAAKRAFD